MRRQATMQSSFLTIALTGKEMPDQARIHMKKAHSKLKLDDSDFDRVLHVFAVAFRTLALMTPDLLTEVMGKLEKFRRDIVII
jgi:truncated hemoglobin YjbI